MAFSDIAPLAASLGFTKAQAETYCGKVAPPTIPVALPEYTKENYKAVLDCYTIDGIEKSNGLVGIARKAGLKVSQVQVIIAEWNRINAAYEAENPPVEEPV